MNEFVEKKRNNRVVAFKQLLRLHSVHDVQVVIGIGEPSIRSMILKKVKSATVELVSIIHPSVFIPNSTVIGVGTIICMGVFISCDTIIGSNVFIQPNVNIGHDCIIEDSSVVSEFANIAGGIHIKKESYIGLSACIRESISVGKYA